MAELLVYTNRPDSRYRSSKLGQTSQPFFYQPRQDYERNPTSPTPSFLSSREIDSRPSVSMPSTATSSPRLRTHDTSSQPSLVSSPSSSLSLDEEFCPDRTVIDLPIYPKGEELVCQSNVPPSSPHEHTFGGESEDEGENENDNEQYDLVGQIMVNDHTIGQEVCRLSTHSMLSTDSPSHAVIPYPSFGDDANLRREPSRHVDYLSHEWRQEDIWCSWRYIVARRKSLDNSKRLENASWRSWAKTQHNLKTVSPEKLNWMKDHDVTWLYGPLQTTSPHNLDWDSPSCKTRVSRRVSFLDKKPILKRIGVSEVMLRRSLSNCTLVREAVDALVSQEPVQRRIRPSVGSRTASDLGYVPLSTPRKMTTETPISLMGSSATPSGAQTPSGERRHIHFNDKVEQCIAINKDVDESYNRHADFNGDYEDEDEGDDTSSDDGIIMMHTGTGRQRKPDQTHLTPKGSFSAEYNGVSSNKTIAMLPSTTLKYRGDTPEFPTDHKGSFWGSDRKLKSSPSSETLRPANPSSNFLLDDDDEEADMSWQPSSMPKSAMKNTIYPRGGLVIGSDDEDEEMESRGLRRTPSGMFMPYEGEDEIGTGGILGKVVDTVNTARDIAHVIWNVGWRR